MKCTLSCIIRTLEVMITTEKNTLTSWRGLCIFLQWAPSLLFEQLLLRIFISHFFPIVFTWWHTRQWLWNTPFPTKKSHTISIPTLHRLWLKKQVVSKKVLGASKIALFTHIWILYIDSVLWSIYNLYHKTKSVLCRSTEIDNNLEKYVYIC